jgi:hypothetical protein
MRVPLISRLVELIKPKVAKPQGMIIGVPSEWYSYGYPPRVDWYRLERIYRTFPMATYAVEQLAEQAVGPGFYLKKAESKGGQSALEICEDFNEEINAQMVMMRIARELAIYGNSPLERRFESVTKQEGDEFKVTELGNLVTVEPLPITTMRIVPDRFTGADPPHGYIQLIMGQYNRFAPEQIAWFRMNVTGGMIGADFYGMGLLQPVSDYVWGLMKMEDAMIKIMDRYAAPKYLWTLGDKDNVPGATQLDAWGAKLKTIEANEDWVAAYTTHLQAFAPDVRARFEEWIQHFKSCITAGVQNPNLLLTMTPQRVSDASATAMQEAWTRKEASVQTTIKELWEDLIYKPIVGQEGLEEEDTPQMIWGAPQVEDPKDQIDQLTKLLNPGQVLLSPETRFDIENMLRQSLDMDALTTPPPLSVRVMPPAPAPGAAPPATEQELLGEKIRELKGSHDEVHARERSLTKQLVSLVRDVHSGKVKKDAALKEAQSALVRYRTEFTNIALRQASATRKRPITKLAPEVQARLDAITEKKIKDFQRMLDDLER